MAAKAANLPHGGDRKSDQSAHGRSDAENRVESVAAVMKVSPRLVERTKRILKDAPAQVVKLMEHGPITVDGAESVMLHAAVEGGRPERA